MFGDDGGFIHILYFKNPINSLFDPVRKKSDPTKSDRTAANSVQRVFWDVSLRRFFILDLFFFSTSRI